MRKKKHGNSSISCHDHINIGILEVEDASDIFGKPCWTFIVGMGAQKPGKKNSIVSPLKIENA